LKTLSECLKAPEKQTKYFFALSTFVRLLQNHCFVNISGNSLISRVQQVSQLAYFLFHASANMLQAFIKVFEISHKVELSRKQHEI